VGSAKAYPEPLGRVTFCDPETGKRLRFLTNNFTIDALVIANIYKSRCVVELFSGGSRCTYALRPSTAPTKNAVKTQIWIAISVYVLIAIVQKRLGIELTLYQILQILSLTLFETPHFTGTAASSLPR
jgi:hypothetical protein